MVKIKRKVEMTLPELIEWGFKNGIKNKAFVRDRDSVRSQLNFKPIAFNSSGYVEFSNDYSYSPEDTFTVEIEKEITEEKVLPKVLVVFNNGHKDREAYMVEEGRSIKDIIEGNNVCVLDTKTIHLINDDGTHTLIWKDGELVGDE
ncbi:hypothetical protein [Staphylococcus hominis]|uniref:Phage PVL protein n=1 Tax=Staphylococcus hominis TaxID=1290 RepID=A0A8X8GKL2_STAHO|nr:hypothetical protein [Staphylococcus hominis]MCM5673369.1 hypothetical protein [Staphylococcus hominis]